ncbi:MAG: tRNA pseudouridine(38-40) synthase TruA, partial [Spirochaetales bacterium]
KGMRTIQGETEKALFCLHKKPTTLYGSGRTDSGVHAFAQAANFFSPFDTIPIERYATALNALLPKDIRIHTAEEKPQDFNARFSAVSRTYRYFFHCNPEAPFAHQMPYIWPLYRKPNLKTLNAMASLLKGEMNCESFSAVGDKSLSKQRFIENASFFYEGDTLVFEICANAFLWKMVRTLVGTLIESEKKGKTADDFQKIIDAQNRQFAGTTAPPQGLFLWNVEFTGQRRHK